MNGRVVITGVGVLSPNGSTKDNYIKSLKEGKSGIKFHEHLKDLGVACQ